MNHPPNVAGYLVSAPHPWRSNVRTYFTFPADFDPPWLTNRKRGADYRMTPLTAEEYAKPLIDIVREHHRKLRDPEPQPTQSRPAAIEP